MLVALVDDSLTIVAAREVRSISVNRVGIPRLPRMMSRALFRTIHLVRLIDPRSRSFRTGDAFAVVVPSPEDKRSPVVETWANITPQRFPAPQMHDRWRSRIAGQVLGAVVGIERATIVRMQTAHQPTMLLVARDLFLGPTTQVLLDLGDRQQSLALLIKDDGRDVVIQQRPASRSIGTAREKDLERIVPCHTNDAGSVVSEQLFHLGGPLRMRRATQSEAVSEQPGPIFTSRSVRVVIESLAPQILDALLAVPEVRVPPQPRAKHTLLVSRRPLADNFLIQRGLCFSESFERRVSQLAGIPHVIGRDLRITNAGNCRG